MKSPDELETEQLARSAELARPLVHECNNFLNNLLLQLAVMELEMPADQRADWNSIRRDGKRVAGLLQQWQSQHRECDTGSERTELNALVEEVAAQVRAENRQLDVRVISAPAPLWLAISSGTLKRLCGMLLQYALTAMGEDEARRVLAIRTAEKDGMAAIALFEVEPTSAPLDWSDFSVNESSGAGMVSLMAAACRSLVERRQGSIGVEKEGNDGCALVVKLPAVRQ